MFAYKGWPQIAILPGSIAVTKFENEGVPLYCRYITCLLENVFLFKLPKPFFHHAFPFYRVGN